MSLTAPKPLRLVDVAEAAGVSLSTASRSLRGLPGVTEDLAARVRQVAAELGYIVNAHAQSLAGGPIPVAGLIVQEIDDPYFNAIATGVIQAAADRGLMVQLAQSGSDPRQELEQLWSLVAQRARMIILTGSHGIDGKHEDEVRRLLAIYQRNGGRAVSIGRRSLGVDAMLPDQRSAGRVLADYLAQLGHTNVVIVSGHTVLTCMQERLDGAVEGLQAAGVRFSIATPDHGSEDAGRIAVHALRAGPTTTALLLLEDNVATSIVSTLRLSGIAVPADVSVACYDSSLGESSQRELTAAGFDASSLGRTALDLAIRKAATRTRRRHTVAELAVRQSTAGPRTTRQA